MKIKARLFRRGRSALLALVLLSLVASTPHGQTQYPGGAFSPPLAGSTLGASLRNAANATQTQLAGLRSATENWCRRAQSVGYNDPQFRQDYDNVLWNFQGLRSHFNYLAQLALQLGRSRANNAVAELDAGLNIIAEIFAFLEEEYAAGTLDRATILRAARLFQRAIREWETDFRKNSSRMGLAW